MRLSSVIPAVENVGRLSALGERELLVRQDCERQMQSRRCFLLIGSVLRGQAKELRNAQAFEFGEIIAERAGLRRAATRARDLVPAVRRIDARHAGTRIDVDDGAAFEFRKVDGCAVGRRQRDVGQFRARSDGVRRHRPAAPGYRMAGIADYACLGLRSFAVSVVSFLSGSP